MEFGPGETLVSLDGTTILRQRPHPALPVAFAGLDDRTAVAKVSYAGGIWFVLARQVGDAPAEFVPTAQSVVGGTTLDDFLAYAAAQYAGGEGVR